MEYERWKYLILDCIMDIGDLEFQKKAWRGELPGIVSSFVELICNLYDDYSFEAFLKEADHICSTVDIKVLGEFNNELNAFIDNHPDLDDDDEVLKHPEWHKIAKHAQDVCKHFKFSRSDSER